MTREESTFVYLDPDDWVSHFAGIVAEAEICARRHAKALLGDQHEVGRYNAFCAEIEILARQRVAAGAAVVRVAAAQIDAERAGTREVQHAWMTAGANLPPGLTVKLSSLLDLLQRGGAIIELRDPFQSGDIALEFPTGTPIPPASVWRPPHNERGLRAVAARWEGQLEGAVAGGVDPLVPSGVSNRILTEGLRQFATQIPGRAPLMARVVYRDGSEARPFPLNALSLTEQVDKTIPVFRVALLSFRHPEMDGDIDAAWLRNRDVSQVRPAAETDALVYEFSRRQLADLAQHGPRVIWMYQTGLEPAIVGFYRALIQHMLEHGSGISVIPRFYQRNQSFEEGVAWALPN